MGTFLKKGFKIKYSRPKIPEEAETIAEGQELAIECADGYLDNAWGKKSSRAKCECHQNHCEYK